VIQQNASPVVGFDVLHCGNGLIAKPAGLCYT
jgi:hypothetical protein